jgi:sugar phosphate isomerase/epimerase
VIGISTAWLTECANVTGRDIIREFVELGFKGVELVPDDVPLSEASGDRCSLASLDKAEREMAIQMTLRTIEHAEDLGARAVVLHLGKVDMDPEYERLNHLFAHQGLDTPEGRHFIRDKVKERRERRGPHVESIFSSLDHLNREAENRGVLLGVENRYHYHQIPDFEELGIILRRFSGASIRYWHDIGHAHALERLGFIEPGSLLRSFAPLSLGVHIHDALGTDDHWAPGYGEIDFLSLTDGLKSAPIKILEVHGKSDRMQLIRGMEMLEKIGVS